jgi:hypothetical protein
MSSLALNCTNPADATMEGLCSLQAVRLCVVLLPGRSNAACKIREMAFRRLLDIFSLTLSSLLLYQEVTSMNEAMATSLDTF